MTDLDKVWLEGQEIWMAECKGLWLSLPLDKPVLPCTPAVAVDKE